MEKKLENEILNQKLHKNIDSRTEKHKCGVLVGKRQVRSVLYKCGVFKEKHAIL